MYLWILEIYYKISQIVSDTLVGYIFRYIFPYILLVKVYYLKVMKRAASSKHREATKNIQCEKKLLKPRLISSKFGKRVQKQATSTNQKMAASMESLLRLLLHVLLRHL